MSLTTHIQYTTVYTNTDNHAIYIYLCHGAEEERQKELLGAYTSESRRSPWGQAAKINRQSSKKWKQWNPMVTDTTPVCLCVCACARLLTYVRHWYLWESVRSLRPDLRWQMYLPGGTVGMCVCVEGEVCDRGNCKHSVVLRSSVFPHSLSTSCVCCMPVHVSVYVCHRLCVKSRSFS